MNARLYDPVNGRFLGPDPYIQDITNLQSHNPYAYCLNNPFRYTDPTGKASWNSDEEGDEMDYAGDDWYIWLSGMDALLGGVYYAGLMEEFIMKGKREESLLEWGKKQEYAEAQESAELSLRIQLEDDLRILVDLDQSDDAQGQGGKPGFNIDNAVNYLNEHAHSKSQGACSRYVQNALVAGGITDAKTQPVKAGGAYGPLLTKWGFTMITTTLDNYTPVKGDIGVIKGYSGGTPCAAGPCGHIQMYNGTQWVSDYLQSTNRPFYPGPTYQQNAPAFEIYRW